MESKILYRLVSSINGNPNMVETYTLDKYDITGLNDNPHSRDCLQGQPKLRGWYGPMYDGESDGVTVIRYESQAAYNVYST